MKTDLNNSITEGNVLIIVVEIPKDAHDFHLTEDSVEFLFTYRDKEGGVILPKGLYEILGFMTKETISFDVEPYVERCEPLVGVGVVYTDYINPSLFLETASDSFRSFITKHTGYVWENPYKEPDINKDDFYTGYVRDLRKYNEAQSKVVEKLLIIKTK